MITSINFANEDFKAKQIWNSRTAKWFGGVDEVINYTPNDIEEDVIEANKELFKFSKGFGNYFWKPYLIKKSLNEIKNNDYLVYADSGTVFIKNIKPIINFMEEQKQDIICFKLPLIEKQWTKRDTFIIMDCDSEEFTDSRQVTGNFILLKKTSHSENFVNSYLKYCSNYSVISDAPNTMGEPNFPEFIAHRHDQSVLSLLCKKHNVLLLDDLSDYGVFPYKYIHYDHFIYDPKALNTKNNLFKGTILANRKKHPLVYAVKYYIRLFLLKLGLKL